MVDTDPAENCAQNRKLVVGHSGEHTRKADTSDMREEMKKKHPAQLTQTHLTYQVHVSAPVSGEEPEWPGKAKAQTRQTHLETFFTPSEEET